MLIRFSIENFLSFRDRTLFSMIAGKGTLKSCHKGEPVKGISALKATVVYGANASGKSNLIKAIDFGRKLLLNGTKNGQIIDYQYFRLDNKTIKGNSRIEYEIQYKGKNYAYGFVFNSKEIVEEWLYEMGKKSEKKIFERAKINEFDLEPIFKKNKKEQHKQFLNFLAKSTPDNQLFLTEIKNRRVQENVQDIRDLLNVINWFQNSLKVIFPEDKYREGIKSELIDDEKLQTFFEELLTYFDTGIDGICLEKVDLEHIELPIPILNTIKEGLLTATEDRMIMLSMPDNTTYFLSNKENEVIARKFMTKHNIRGVEKTELFDTSDESDGTNRIIDFIPLIIDLLERDNVFIIDEMERSLHPNLIYDIFDLFLSNCQKVNSQLIVASHESSILTQKLLRKDEIWFVVKDKEGASHLHSLQDYNIRFDKNVRKDYLLGRYKAVPRLGNRYALSFLQHQEQ